MTEFDIQRIQAEIEEEQSRLTVFKGLFVGALFSLPFWIAVIYQVWLR